MIQPWFNDAKLGIFIHWGLYSVKGVPESWSIYNGLLTREEYYAQYAGFTASKYNPETWAKLFDEAGAKYAVLTAKHCDGAALWDTKFGKESISYLSPAKRDLVGPFCKAIRKQGLKLGIYCTIPDWKNPDYPTVFRETEAKDGCDHDKQGLTFPRWGSKENHTAWNRFLKFRDNQITELAERYNPDLFWFDGHWERSPKQWKFKELNRKLRAINKNVVLNDRITGFGDYKTPEQGMPIQKPEGPWEFCMTINDSWGWQVHDNNHKSVRQLVRIFTEVIGMGGNLLLDTGPREDGTIVPEHVERLKALGKWIKKHAEAVYGSRAGLPHGYFHGPSTLSADGKTLYLMLCDIPRDQISVKGLFNKVNNVSILGAKQKLNHKMVGGAPWLNIPGILWIDVPQEKLDPLTTVIKVELDSPLKLYAGHGQAIHVN